MLFEELRPRKMYWFKNKATKIKFLGNVTYMSSEVIEIRKVFSVGGRVSDISEYNRLGYNDYWEAQAEIEFQGTSIEDYPELTL